MISMESKQGIQFKGQFNFYYSITRDSVSKGSMLLYMILLLTIGVIGDVLSNAVHAFFAWLL